MNIAIAGGGPAGLVAAIAAQQAGFAATVFEQAPSFGKIGGAIGIQNNGLMVLDALGLFDRFAPCIEPTFCAGVESPPGRVITSADFHELDITNRGFAVALRYDLQDLLLQSALEHGVEVRFNTRCKAVATTANDATLTFDSGDTFKADLVLACDGARSAVRDHAGFLVKRREVGEAYLRAIANIAHPDRSRIGEYWHPDGRRAGAFPLPGARTYVFCSVPIGRWQHILANDLDSFVKSWDDFGPMLMQLMRAIDWRTAVYDELSDVRVKPWCLGRVVLVGDAAHAMTPNLGQGANSAMTDALVFINLLKSASSDVASAAAQYERLRKPFVTRIQDAAWIGGKIASWTSTPARALRDTMIRSLQYIGPIRRSSMLLTAGYNPAEQPHLRSPRS